MTESRFQLSRGDAVEWLRTLPDESIDLVVTDPPYESLEKHRAVGTTTRLKHSKASSNDWFEIFPNTRFKELFVEVHRVLRRNTHFYLFCDPETMFVAKPIAEEVGFKFWKPIIWDKCLGPDTPVWTTRGVVRIADVVVGDRVALPEGGTAGVRATRTTRNTALRLKLSDGTIIVASKEHRFVRIDGSLAEAQWLQVGDTLLSRPVREKTNNELRMDDVIPDEDAVFQLPDLSTCLWCEEPFESFRAASAHQARHCDAALSKRDLAEELGVPAKRLRWWMGQGRIPRAWARALGLEDKLGARVQCTLQNDVTVWYPRTIPLDYDLGKLIGLYAAEGSHQGSCGITFATHTAEKHLHSHIARVMRTLGIHTLLETDGNTTVVKVNFKIAEHLVDYFVGGRNARDKYFKPTVYAANDEFRRGVLAGLLEGDGHWEHETHREVFVSASRDLSLFVKRETAQNGRCPKIHRFENDYAGGWKVSFDPKYPAEPLSILEIEDIGEQELIDISIDHPDELFLLGNGAVTHNCKIGMGYHYRARYECVLFFEKGKRKLNDLGIADIISHPRVNGGYPAEKPPEVSSVLITQSTQPGELVIDPFMGSGSVGVAATSIGRNFMGNDLCREAVDITRTRLLEGGAHELNTTLRGDEHPQLGLGM